MLQQLLRKQLDENNQMLKVALGVRPGLSSSAGTETAIQQTQDKLFETTVSNIITMLKDNTVRVSFHCDSLVLPSRSSLPSTFL